MPSLSPKVSSYILGLAALIVVITWVSLVIWQPADSDWNSLASSQGSAFALVGFLVPALMALVAILPHLPVRTLALMPFAVAINAIIGQIIGTMGLPLPLYLDSFGTVIVGALAGPAAGMTTGLLSALVWGVWNPTVIPFAAAYAFVGLAAGVGRKFFLGSWWKPLVYGAIVGFVTALLSAPVASFIFGGTAGTGTGLLVSFYRSLGFEPMTAVFLQSWTSDPLDKVIVFGISAYVVSSLPQRTLKAFDSSTVS